MAEKLVPLISPAEEPYVAYSSDRDEEEPPTTSCATAAVRNRPDWMREMGPKLMNAKVGEVVWPGTHDSGANCELFDFNKVVHDHWLRYIGTHLLNCLGHGFRRFASDWSRAQTLSIRQQLEHGVRYIDLRVSKCVQDNEYYIVHTFCGPLLRNVLSEIKGFLSEHEGECLLLEVTPVYGVDHIELHTLFEGKLGHLLLKRDRGSYQISPISLTLSHLVQKGRILLLYKFPVLYGYMESTLCFWESRCIHAPFVMTLDPSVKEGYQLENFTNFTSKYHQSASKKHKCLFHFMYALTPTLSEILKSAPISKYFVSGDNLGSLEECAQTMNPKLSKFVERIKRHADAEQSSDVGMIVSVDFVEESELVEHILSFNGHKFGN